MNVPSFNLLNFYLNLLGSSSLGLGNGSVGLIAAPFSGNPTLGLTSQITEASYPGYARQALTGPSVVFTGTDGNQYVEFSTLRFQPTGSTTVNTIYGVFYTGGSSTVNIFQTDALSSPVGFAGPSNQLTFTPRCGLNPAGNYGLNIIST